MSNPLFMQNYRIKPLVWQRTAAHRYSAELPRMFIGGHVVVVYDTYSDAVGMAFKPPRSDRWRWMIGGESGGEPTLDDARAKVESMFVERLRGCLEPIGESK